MALPSFYGQSGLALIRGSVATGEWWFVDWVSGDVDIIVDAPGPGTWRYEVWVICGAGGPWTYAAYGNGFGSSYSARADLTVQSLKR